MTDLEWRQPPDDRFEHLFVIGEAVSCCGEVTFVGERVEDFDPSAWGARGNTGLLCPHCRRWARVNVGVE